MEIEERVAKIEAVIAEDAKVEKWERRLLRWFKFTLLVIAVSAIVIWAASEFTGFAVDRVEYVRHALGW